MARYKINDMVRVLPCCDNHWVRNRKAYFEFLDNVCKIIDVRNDSVLLECLNNKTGREWFSIDSICKILTKDEIKTGIIYKINNDIEVEVINKKLNDDLIQVRLLNTGEIKIIHCYQIIKNKKELNQIGNKNFQIPYVGKVVKIIAPYSQYTEYRNNGNTNIGKIGIVIDYTMKDIFELLKVQISYDETIWIPKSYITFDIFYKLPEKKDMRIGIENMKNDTIKFYKELENFENSINRD